MLTRCQSSVPILQRSSGVDTTSWPPSFEFDFSTLCVFQELAREETRLAGILHSLRIRARPVVVRPETLKPAPIVSLGKTACDDGIIERPKWKSSAGKLLAPISKPQCFYTFPLPSRAPKPYPPTISTMHQHSHQRTWTHIVGSCCKICCHNQPIN